MSAYHPLDMSPEARAHRHAPNNPRPLCRDFTQKPDPAASWCATCGWIEALHADDAMRTAIAAALGRLAAEADR